VTFRQAVLQEEVSGEEEGSEETRGARRRRKKRRKEVERQGLVTHLARMASKILRSRNRKCPHGSDINTATGTDTDTGPEMDGSVGRGVRSSTAAKEQLLASWEAAIRNFWCSFSYVLLPKTPKPHFPY